MKKNIIITGSVLLASVSSFAARPLGTDDYGTLEKGKSGFELGYDNSQNLAFAVKFGPFKNVELSAEYALPSGATFAFDQVAITAKVTLAEKALGGLDYGVKVKVDNVAKTLGLTGIATLQNKDYNVHGNVSYLPDTPLTFLVAGELETLEPIEPVGELSVTGANINGLVGLRYELSEGNIVDVAATFPVSGGGTSTQFIGCSSEF